MDFPRHQHHHDDGDKEEESLHEGAALLLLRQQHSTPLTFPDASSRNNFASGTSSPLSPPDPIRIHHDHTSTAMGEGVDPENHHHHQEKYVSFPNQQPHRNEGTVKNFYQKLQACLPMLTSTTSTTTTTTSTIPSGSSVLRDFLYYAVYAGVNVILSVPGLYGYAAVIFHHPVYASHMNALSKLVILSSLMHQAGMTLFSSLPFAMGTVQDAGLIFLSAMSQTLANRILDQDGGTEEEVLLTAVVLLSLGTATLGLILIGLGKYKLADAVSYLPMPVVGGYLAFIGYFCLQAGTALAISQPMETLTDWALLWKDAHTAVLAVPALLTGLLLTLVSRNATHDAMLPLTMVAIPALFYLVIYMTGLGMDGARQQGWVGQEAPSVPVSELLTLIDFSLVRWDLIGDILFTWMGMVFVVSFASCLDVAAISMDMGEALDTNKELMTVGICNVMSGLSMGFTGSYIFSQTIFTYRTGIRSRWIGIFVMMVFLYVVVSPLNLLQVSPLFFLGSTLIFIGYDLLWEWMIEIRHKVFLSEYLVVWATFVAIQIVGMDVGILLGVLVAVVDHAVGAARTTEVTRVNKKSRAVWTREEYRLLQDQGYNAQYPKIVTLEVTGNAFFGSSMHLLQRLTEELGLERQREAIVAENCGSVGRGSFMASRSPHTSSLVLREGRLSSRTPDDHQRRATVVRRSPKFVCIELTKLNNMDASAARGCFRQLVRMCSKKGIVVCAAGATPHVTWILRTHQVAYSVEEEEKVKGRIQSRPPDSISSPRTPLSVQTNGAPAVDGLLLFMTIHEALEFCENALIHQLMGVHAGPYGAVRPWSTPTDETNSLSSVFGRILGSSDEEHQILGRLDGKRYHDEVQLKAGQLLFAKESHADAFYTVLRGAVAVAIDASDPRRTKYRNRQRILTGAGLVRTPDSGSLSNLMAQSILDGHNEDSTEMVASIWPVGGVIGYVDFILDRPRNFRAVATQDGTSVARITASHLHLVQNEEPALDALIQRVLLKASILDLANCTCDE